jgi:putative ABC transport system permease protein
MRTLRDVSHAIRNLRRSPGFTAVVVLTLAVGIGANTAIFSIVRAVLLRPLAYPEPGRLVRITSELRGFGATDTGVAPQELFDYQSRTDLFTGVAGLLPVSANVTSGDVPDRVDMLLVSWNYFSILGVPPALGRIFGPEDDTPGVANLAVVSDGYWRRRLGADPRAVGRTIVIDGDGVELVGVMPAGFHHPGRTSQTDVDVWSPAGYRGPAGAPPDRVRRRLAGCLARLRPGMTEQQAQARLDDYASRVSREFPADYPARDGWNPRVVPLRDDVVGSVTTPMLTLVFGVGLVLLVACVNVAHLVLARSTERRQEMAIRQALGASIGRLTWQLAVESAVLATAGAMLGLLVASWGLRGLIALAPGRVPRIADAGIDAWAVAVSGLVALVSTLLFGLVPALRLRQENAFAIVKEGGPGRSQGVRAGRARNILVAAEVAMATVLLLASGLFVRSVAGLLNVPLGFDPDRLVTARVELPRPNDFSRAVYRDHERRVGFYRDTLRRVRALPGVARVAMSTQIPMAGFNPPLFVEIDGRDALARDVRPVMHSFQVSPGYFETMGVPIVKGRAFTESDRAGDEAVALVSQTAARTFWKDQDPIGQRLRFDARLPWMTVIGVAGDVLNRRLSESPQPILYQSLEQASGMSLALLIRQRGETPGLGEAIAREVRAIDPELPVYAIRTMTDVLGSAVAERRFLMRLLVAFGAIATGLALLGIYGVMAYSVSQRTREIGIRIAIGARQEDVSRMVMRQGIALTAAGVAAGVVAGLSLSQFIKSQLFGVQPSDPKTLIAVLLVMTIVGAAAAYLPARRAASIDPIRALRD